MTSTSTYHVHGEVYDEPAPSIDRIEVLRVSFRRGDGCCDKSLVRVVTAYYGSDGRMLWEFDPARAGATGEGERHE